MSKDNFNPSESPSVPPTPPESLFQRWRRYRSDATAAEAGVKIESASESAPTSSVDFSLKIFAFGKFLLRTTIVGSFIGGAYCLLSWIDIWTALYLGPFLLVYFVVFLSYPIGQTAILFGLRRGRNIAMESVFAFAAWILNFYFFVVNLVLQE